jgi:hypothetical protein
MLKVLSKGKNALAYYVRVSLAKKKFLTLTPGGHEQPWSAEGRGIHRILCFAIEEIIQML